MDEVIVRESPLPEDVRDYAGQWVAIRDRSVVASAPTLPELWADERVRETDAVFAVPTSPHFL